LQPQRKLRIPEMYRHAGIQLLRNTLTDLMHRNNGRHAQSDAQQYG